MGHLFEGYASFIPDFEEFQEALNRPIPTHLRINTLKTDVDRVVDSLQGGGVKIKMSLPGDPTLVIAPELEKPGKLLDFQLGHIHVQALTSCIASLLLRPKPGQYVLDMCAAPGGKTSHMAQLMRNTGLIVANELYRDRHISLGHNLGRLGVTNTIITGYQAQQFPMRQKFDLILADVPCSGEGTFRKTRACQTYKEKPEKRKLPALQKKILTRGFDLLKPGGMILYSTCTFNPDENEAVVSALLSERDAELLTIDLELSIEPGITEWKGQKYDARLRHAARFYPHRINSVGFFMAKISKPG